MIVSVSHIIGQHAICNFYYLDCRACAETEYVDKVGVATDNDKTVKIFATKLATNWPNQVLVHNDESRNHNIINADSFSL